MGFLLKLRRIGYVRMVLASLIVASSFGRGASFVVTNEEDTMQGSLRGAILAANRRGGANTIFLSGSVYQLTLSGIDEDEGQTGDLDITRGNLLIIGRGADVTIDASALGDRIFQIFPGAKVTLVNVTCIEARRLETRTGIGCTLREIPAEHSTIQATWY